MQKDKNAIKRGDVSFDKRFFERGFDRLTDNSIEDRFNYIYRTNHWRGKKSISGQGSELSQTKTIRENLPEIFVNYKIQSMLDLPCGDFNWMETISLNLSSYIGGDIVQEIIDSNNRNYSNEIRSFVKLDITKDPLPKVDLIFCRDCFVHLSNDDILKAIENIKKSQAKLFMTTTFTACRSNEDIVTGDWRILNLLKKPFNFPKATLILNENCTEGDGTYADKSLGLWKINDL